MVLLQFFNHLINRYIRSNWLSAKHEFASRKKFFQVSLPLKLEAQTGSKIFSDDCVTSGTFLPSLAERFCQIFGNARFLPIFAHSKLLWTEQVAHLFCSANFTLISEK